MKEATQLQAPKTLNYVWVVLKRILAVVVILIAMVGFLADSAGLAGVWIFRQPVRNTVMALSKFVNAKLGIIDQSLARVSARTDQGRQALTRVNDAASKLSDRFEENSPVLTVLTRAAGNDLAPKIADLRTQAAALRDGVLAVNASLETLDSFGFVAIPTFGDELSAVSERVDAVQDDLQELRVAIDEARTGASANIVAATTARTTKIDNILAQIKSTATKYQSTVAQKRQQVTDVSHRVLRVINLMVLLLTALFLVTAAGQLLLIYVCWQYVRRGRLPLLRVE